MSREWKPGDVAMVTWKALGRERTDRLVRSSDHHAVLGADVWMDADGTWIGDATAKVVRPLVVIDPEDREQVEALARAYIATWRQEESEPHDQTVAIAQRQMQAALRSLVADPRPEEPQGLGAVVECSIDGQAGHGIYTGAGWVFRTAGLTDYSVQWGQFDTVRVLSEGWRA